MGTHSFRTALERGVFTIFSLVIASICFCANAMAISIELKDVAADRIERQKMANDGRLPLPETPDIRKLKKRLAAKGLTRGAPVLIRVFKAESKLEVWMKKNGKFILFANYPICNWSGTLGPKIAEGDKQTPEGFYTVTRRQLHLVGRWPRSLNLGYPNIFDQSHARTGSFILIHGGCSSVGCFAMTNTVMEEIYKLTSAAIRKGQHHVPIHVFPFRMSDKNLSSHKASPWFDFWQELKAGYDAFEKTHLPPQISVCEGRYTVREATTSTERSSRPLALCGGKLAANEISGLLERIALDPHQWTSLPQKERNLLERVLEPQLRQDLINGKVKPYVKRRLFTRVRNNNNNSSTAQSQSAPRLVFRCNPARASCRKHIALKRKAWARNAMRNSKKRRKLRTAQRRKR